MSYKFTNDEKGNPMYIDGDAIIFNFQLNDQFLYCRFCKQRVNGYHFISEFEKGQTMTSHLCFKHDQEFFKEKGIKIDQHKSNALKFFH